MGGLSLLHPWGLLSLAGLAAVGVIYLFYFRHRPRRVTALFLWDAPMAAARGGRRLEPPRFSRSLLLDLLACVLLALAMSGPAWTSSAGSSLVLILDGSLSMRAGGNHLRVREQALALVEARGKGRVWVVEAGSEPRVVVEPTVPSGGAREALAGYKPWATADSVGKAVTLARRLTTGEAEIHVFTDHELELPAVSSAELSVHLLGGRGANVALIEALRRYPAFSDRERVSLGVRNFSDRPQSVLLRVEEEGGGGAAGGGAAGKAGEGAAGQVDEGGPIGERGRGAAGKAGEGAAGQVDEGGPIGERGRGAAGKAGRGGLPAGPTRPASGGVLLEERLELAPGAVGQRSLTLARGTGMVRIALEASDDRLLEDSYAMLVAEPEPRVTFQLDAGLGRSLAPIRKALLAAGAVEAAGGGLPDLRVARDVTPGVGQDGGDAHPGAGQDGGDAHPGASRDGGDASPGASRDGGDAPRDVSWDEGDAPRDVSRDGREAPPGAGQDGGDAPGAGGLTLRLRAVGARSAYLGPFVIDTADSLCQGMDLTGVFWAADLAWKAPSGATSLISLQDSPLLARLSPTLFVLNLDLEHSNLARSPAWPVFFANLVQQAGMRSPGLRQRNYLPGALLKFGWEGASREWGRLEGRGLELPLAGAGPWRVPEQPGWYRLVRSGAGTVERAVQAVAPGESDLRGPAVWAMVPGEVGLAVQAVAPGESDLRGLASADSVRQVQGRRGTGGALNADPLEWPLVALAVLLVMLNAWLERRDAQGGLDGL